MYKNFNLTDEERKEIMEQHKSHGYKKPLNENYSKFVHGDRLDKEPKYKVGDYVMVTFSNDGGWDRRSIPYKGTIMSIDKEIGINNNEKYVYEVMLDGGDTEADDSMFDKRSFSKQPGEVVKVMEHMIHKKY